MPTVLRVRGYRFYFFSKEGNEPPRVHVESAENYAKFWLTPVALVDSVGYDARELRVLHNIVDEHRDALERAWRDFFNPS